MLGENFTFFSFYLLIFYYVTVTLISKIVHDLNVDLIEMLLY